MNTTDTTKYLVWKNVFIALSVLSLVLMPFFSISHGMSGDEWSLIIYGHDIYDYFFNHGTKALDYDVLNWQQVAGLHYYGGLYDFTVTFLHKTLFPATDELTFRHIVNSLIGALLFIYTGLLGKHFGGWRTGVLAFIFIALSPRILGESMNNPKDIPFAFANVFFLYHLLRYIVTYGDIKSQWKYALLMGLGFGLAMGFRIGGILMIPYTFVFLAAYYLWDKVFQEKIKNNFGKAVKIIAANLAVTFILGYIIAIIFWPWALQAPLSKPLEALDAMTHRKIPIRMLYDGAYIMNTEVPNTYTTKWIFISNPIYIVLSFIVSLVFIIPLSKKYGKPNLFLLLFTLVFPIAYAVYKHSVLHDTWRHFFFVYPSMVLLAALLSNYFIEKFASQKLYQYITMIVVLVGMLLPLSWIVNSFPNEYVYFNEFSGGIKKAAGVYDLDYYQNSGKQAAEWIKHHAKSTSSKVIVASNMSSIEKYFTKDSSKFSGVYVRYNDRDTKDWDYYITYSRFISLAQLENGTWPPKNAVHTIAINDVPICAVLERKTKLDMQASAAMERQHLDSAFALYQQAVQADASNDAVLIRYATVLAQRGDIQNSLKMLDEALKIDAGNPAIYNLKMQIFKAIRDNNRAIEAENMLRSLMQ
ncbi:MAG: tetratricopeptide repeat protein [Phycisphaerales bacterium]|nr:tetratricopeptide repeat protein [Phycisphaerales bacterium]